MNKKMLSALAIFALLLTGCSDAYTKVSNQSDAVITVGSEVVTKEQYYTALTVSSSADTSHNAVLEYILEQETANIDVSEKAQTKLEWFKEYYGDLFSIFLTYNGYETEEDFLNGKVYPQVKKTALVEKYVREKWDVYSTTNIPVKAQVLKYTDEETANKALALAKEGTSLSDVNTEYAGTTYVGDDVVYISSSSLDTNALAAIKTVNSNGLIETVIKGSDDASFFVVNIVECNPENFKEEAITAIAENNSDVEGTATRYFFKQYEFKIHDKLVHDIYLSTTTYSDYIFE